MEFKADSKHEGNLPGDGDADAPSTLDASVLTKS